MSTPVVSDGEVNSTSVRWSYERKDDPNESVLSWTYSQAASTDLQRQTIAGERIIAAVSATGEDAHGHRILYIDTENTAAESDVKASSSSCISISAINPPTQFLNDFEPSEESFLSSISGLRGSLTALHVIVSTGSGTGKARMFSEKALLPLLHELQPSSKKDFSFHFTASEDTITELGKRDFLSSANQGRDQTIVLLSGDGGLVDVVNALLSEQHSPRYRSPNVALLPVGTGNALANSSGIMDDKTTGLSSLLRGQPRELPLFRATFSPGARHLVDEARQEAHLQIVDGTPTAYGAVVCSWGLHAALVADSDTAEYRKFGAERFKMAGKEALFPSDGSLPHPYRGTVSVLGPSADGSAEWKLIPRHEHGYVLATLVSQLEAGFTISPSSQPLDGKLRLVHFGPLSGQDAMSVMTKAYQGGQHVQDDNVGYEEIHGLRIEFDEEDARWRRICIDGKIIRVEKGGWVEVRMDVKPVVNLIVMPRTE